MDSRLLIGVLGNRDSGKSHTWNRLFGATVRTGRNTRHLQLRPGECVEVFLVSGSFEERGVYAGDVLESQDCRIVLCSLQYTEEVRATLRYLVNQDFQLYVQWLNPGYHDREQMCDRLEIVNSILLEASTISIRDGQADASGRVQEIREFVYGWAKYRDLILPC